MAYNATEFIQNLQVENLVFIPPGNNLVSSQYALYINGVGQTYWAEGINSESLNQFSTVVYTYINSNNSNFTSSIQSLESQLAIHSTQIFNLSTSVSTLFVETAYLSTLLESEISTTFSTTNYIIYSTFYSLSTYTEFSTQINALEVKLECGLSTLSTTLYLQNTSTYNSLVDQLASSIISTTIYINSSISSVVANSVTVTSFSTFSSIITNQLLSTSIGFIQYVNDGSDYLYDDISTLAVSTNANTSTIKSLQAQVSSLQSFSTSISTVSYTWISSYVSTSQSIQNDGITQALSTSVGSLIISTAPFLNTLSSLSSAVYVTNSNVDSLFSTTASLEYNFNLLTTSSLIASIYDSFIQLEQYSYNIISNAYNVISYSTNIQNQSIAEAYYSSITDSLYASTLSTLIPETELYLSSLVSTLYFESNRFLQSTAISSMNSSIIGLTDLYADGIISSIYETSELIITSTLNEANDFLSNFQASTLSEYNDFIDYLEIEGGLSTLYTNTTLQLYGMNYVGVLDFTKYRNFHIDVFNIINGPSNYRITYDPNSLVDHDYINGFITINISTPTSIYQRNKGKLQFDVYQWGIPTTVWGNVFPTISQSDYMLHYQYMIQNKTIYTKLLNVFPKLAITSMYISSIVENVQINYETSKTQFWRGTPVTIYWSSYSSYPTNHVRGEAPFDPTIIIETYLENDFFEDFGPFDYNAKSAVINLPHASRYNNKLILDVDIYVKVTGLNNEGYQVSSLQVVLPSFDTVTIRNPNNSYIGGTELVGVTDNYNFLLKNSEIDGTNTNISYDPPNNPQTLVTGFLNTAGEIGSTDQSLEWMDNLIFTTNDTDSVFYENTSDTSYPSFIIRKADYFDYPIGLQQFGSQINFQFTTADTSYILSNARIIYVNNNTYNIYNNTISQENNTFTDLDSFVNLTFSYTFPTYISTNTQYSINEHVFVNNTSNEQLLIFSKFFDPIFDEPFKQFVFYNLIDIPRYGSEIANTEIEFSFTFGENDDRTTYTSTVTITDTSKAQTYLF